MRRRRDGRDGETERDAETRRADNAEIREQVAEWGHPWAMTREATEKQPPLAAGGGLTATLALTRPTRIYGSAPQSTEHPG